MARPRMGGEGSLAALEVAQVAEYAVVGLALGGASMAWCRIRKGRLEGEDDDILSTMSAEGGDQDPRLPSWTDGVRDQVRLCRVRPQTVETLSERFPGEWDEEAEAVSAAGYLGRYESAGASPWWLAATLALGVCGGLVGGLWASALVATAAAIGLCDLSWRVAPIPLLFAYALFGQLTLSPEPVWSVVLGCASLLALGGLSLAVGQDSFGFGDALAVSAAVAALADTTLGLLAFCAALLAGIGIVWLVSISRHRELGTFALCPLLVMPTLVAVAVANYAMASQLGVMIP